MGAACGLLSSCKPVTRRGTPSISFTRIPKADPGGSESQDIVEGTVSGGASGQRVVIYAKSGKWWIQPLVSQPFTQIREDLKWSNATHLGTEYAALLVDQSFTPLPTLDELPPIGMGLLAIARVQGAAVPPSKTISFCGYDWRLRDAPSDRGGNNRYDPSNVFTDEEGAMHLRITRKGDDWTCSEVSLTRSLGYGEYRFVVRDIGQLEPVAVFGMFTWDYAGGEQGNREMDIELSQWGDPSSKNAQFVVQPYYVAANVARFTAPPGPLTHSFHWEPGQVTFRTIRGRRVADGGPLVEEHIFRSGVPSPGIESVRMNLYVFRNAQRALHKEAEVVVEKFEYLP